MTLTIADIAQQLDAEVVGDAQIEISGLGSLGTARPGQISHLSSPAYRHLLADTHASAVIVKPQDAADCPVCAVVVDNPYLAFAKVSQLFVPSDSLSAGQHPSAQVGHGSRVDPQASIGSGVVIGEGCVIEAGVKIFPNVVIGDRCHLAQDVVLRANVTLYSDVTIGPRSVLHSGCVIGADGFGFTPDQNGHMQAIAQLGGVEIGADVSVGAGSTIDCGAIENTVVEDGVKIDNLVQIGHNSRIGAHSLICGCVGIAGSSVIGKHCVLAGGAGVRRFSADRPAARASVSRLVATFT